MQWQWLDALALTHTERRVAVFLAVTLVLGAAVRVFNRAGGTAGVTHPAAADSMYAAVNADSRLGAPAAPIDLNTATRQELARIPGISDKLAGAIVRVRRQRGGFRRIDELLLVPGLGTRRYETMCRYVAVRTKPAETQRNHH